MSQGSNRGKTPGMSAEFSCPDARCVQFKLCVSAPEDLDGLSSTQLRELVIMLLSEGFRSRAGDCRTTGRDHSTEGSEGTDQISSPAAWTKPPNRPEPGWQKGRPTTRQGPASRQHRGSGAEASGAAGSRFKGYETYLVQGLVLSVRAIRYRRQRWVTPDGQTIVAALPAGNDRTFRSRPAPFRVDAVSSRSDHAAASDGAVAFARRVDLEAGGPTAVDREAGYLP